MNAEEAITKITSVPTSHLRRLLPGAQCYLYCFQRNSNEELAARVGALCGGCDSGQKRLHRYLPVCQPVVLQLMSTTQKVSNPLDDISFE